MMSDRRPNFLAHKKRLVTGSPHPKVTRAPLRPEQCVVDDVQPAQDAIDDCPEYRMVVGVRYRDGKSATKAHTVFRTLDPDSVVAISVHFGCSLRQAAT